MSTRSRSEAELSKLLYGDLLRVYPQLAGVKVTHAWSGLMSYARHAMPQIGRLPDGLWYALGFGGHGVAPTTLGGEVLADAMTGASPVPAQLAAYGLQPTYGKAGLIGAQLLYWALQARDAMMDWRRGGLRSALGRA
jgi:gamma-glutamylputrescine oxidase